MNVSFSNFNNIDDKSQTKQSNLKKQLHLKKPLSYDIVEFQGGGGD